VTKLDTIAWKTQHWKVHPEMPHAILIPGYEFYGGLPTDVAQGIVNAMNEIWLLKNPEALKNVQTGIEQAEAKLLLKQWQHVLQGKDLPLTLEGL